MTDYQRYAVYFAATPQTELARFGHHWLGRDPANAQVLSRPLIPGLKPDDIIAATTSPSRYGFHGTLKPPFVLQDRRDSAGLEHAIAEMCASMPPVTCGPLALKSIGHFIALCPTGPVDGLGALASTLVRELDDFRKPQGEAEMNKRRAVGLTPRQERYLTKWGYPYVMDEFRFHLTLTNKLEDDQLDRFMKLLAPMVAPLCVAPFAVNDVCLFGDPGGGKPFRLLKRFALKG